MKKKHNKQRKFGLLGKNIGYSFSKSYFTEKFKINHFENCEYNNYDMASLAEIETIIATKGLEGLNVTIPYKEKIIPLLTKITKNAQKIGAVNCIKVTKKKKLIGYNTDFYGFKKSLKPLLKEHHKRALIFGTGGASKAVAFALKKLEIEYDFVSRTENEHFLSYDEIGEHTFLDYTIFINTTPVGTFPNVKENLNIPFEFFTKKHIAFDLIYNPEETQFLKNAKKQGAIVQNGQQMLEFQAEKAWKLWNK